VAYEKDAAMARAESKLDTRRRIVASAGRAIREQGLQKPSVNEVMAGAGLTVGGFYAHFDNKDALFLESLDSMLRGRLNEWLQQLPEVAASERRQLAARGYLSRKHRNQASERCPMPMILGEMDRVDPRFRDVLAEHVQRWTLALTDSADPQDRARALTAVATMVGALSLARALGPTEFSDELLTAAKAAIA
jgi:TetR/AcrR family transcriptional repressor of nem operon